MTDTVHTDPENPWPWLEPFTENASHSFGGRDEDVQALLRGVLAAPVCVLFGKSGLGKTSLLLAGLFPALRARMLLPVAVRRLEHGQSAATVSAQLSRALAAAASQAGLHWSRPSHDGSALDSVAELWEQLHEREQLVVDRNGRRWTPVFVLDQFEEVFTLEPEEERRRQLFQELGDLLENRVPPAVARRLETDQTLLDRIDLDSQPVRFLISLREDFLPELEYWADMIPRLGPNRYRLLPLSDRSALEAIRKTGGALVDGGSAQRIVQFLGRQAAQGARVREERRIEPALLSLVCASLNADRLSKDPPGRQLDVGDLDTRGAQILDRFYDDAFAALDEDVRAAAAQWVETNLITPSGSRRPYPLEAVDGSLGPALGVLEKRRLLRTEPTEQGDQIELVHDRLAGIASQRALARQRRTEEAERLRRQKEDAETEVLKQRAQMAEIAQARAHDALQAAQRARRLTWGLAVIAVMAAGSAGAAVWQASLAEQGRQAAVDAQNAAKQAQIEAEAERDAAKLASEAARRAWEAAQLARKAADAVVETGPRGSAAAAELRVQADRSYAIAAGDVQELQDCPSGKRVYPHVTEGERVNENFLRALRGAGFIVPPVESLPRGNMPGKTAVRYFRTKESGGADAAVMALRSAGLGDVSPQYIRGYENSKTMRPCHYELWIAPSP